MKGSTLKGFTSIQDSEILKSNIIDSIINDIKIIQDAYICKSLIVSRGDEIKLTRVPYIIKGYITGNDSFSTFITPEAPISGFTVYTDTEEEYTITSAEQSYTPREFYNLIKDKMNFKRTMTTLEGVPINGTYLSEIVWGAI